jgi:hypothetical protein
MYAPRKNFVYHYYANENAAMPADLLMRRKFHKEPAPEEDGNAREVLFTETLKRWRHLLGLGIEGPPRPGAMQDLQLFGLGTRRTLQQYQEFAGVLLVSPSSLCGLRASCRAGVLKCACALYVRCRPGALDDAEPLRSAWADALGSV